jgi:uncharacterized protein (DUF58 family)
MRLAKRPAVAFVVSDFHAAGFEGSMRLAAQKHDITAVSLTDPRELALPRAGLVRLQDLETGRDLLIDTEDRRQRAQYEADAAARQVERRRLLAGLGVDEVPLRTDQSYIQPLMAYFRARAAHRRIA